MRTILILISIILSLNLRGQTVKELDRQALEAVNNKDYKGAKVILEKALKINTDNAEVPYDYANLLCYYFPENKEDIVKYYQQAIDLAPEFIDAYINYAAYLAFDYKKDEEYALKAETLYQTALKYDPNNPLLYYGLGYLYHARFNNLTKAKKCYELALKLNDKLVMAHIKLAFLLLQAYNDFDNARLHYEGALSYNPDDALTRLNYALLLKNKFSDDKEAAEQFKIAVSLNPQLGTEENNKLFGIK